MTRNPLPRVTATITLTIELSAADETEASERLAGIAGFLQQRLSRSTFRRLAGMPTVTQIEPTKETPDV